MPDNWTPPDYAKEVWQAPDFATPAEPTPTPAQQSQQQEQPGILSKLFKFDPESFKGMMESAAHPQSAGDLLNLIIPGDLGPQFRAAGKYLGFGKKAEEAAPVIEKAATPPKYEPVPVTRVTRPGDPLVSDKPETWLIQGHLSDEDAAKVNDMYTRGKGTVHRITVDKNDLKGIDQNMTDEFGNKLATIDSAKLGATKDIPLPSEQQPIDKLTEALKSAKPQRELQEKMYTAERGKRIQAVKDISTPGVAGYQEQLGQLKGELPKIDYEGLKLTPQDTDSLIDLISNSGKITDWEKLSAKSGLMKILTGSEVPQRNELDLLRSVFGANLPDVIQGPRPFRLVSDTSNLMKTLMASVDLSAPFRQGFPLIHTKQFWQSFSPMVKAAASEDAYQSIMKGIEERPNYMLGREAGLHITDLESLSSREENFMSKWAEMVPGVRQSERAYTTFLNKLRADTFDNLISKAKAAGLDTTGSNKLTDQIANYVNVSTGRGSLGRFEKIAPELNSVFFSPRLMASRVAILNPSYYINAEPLVRKEAIKSLLAIGGAGLLMDGLGQLAGGTSSPNPLSADFGKIKFGNTRIDPWAGFQQYGVAFDRFLTGKTDSKITSGMMAPDRFDIAKNFAANKLSPIYSLAYNIASAQPNKEGELSRFGKPINYVSEVGQRFIPMFIQDVYDLYKDDPNLFPMGEMHFSPKLAAIPAGALGMGTQTYQSPVPTYSPFRLRP